MTTCVEAWYSGMCLHLRNRKIPQLKDFKGPKKFRNKAEFMDKLNTYVKYLGKGISGHLSNWVTHFHTVWKVSALIFFHFKGVKYFITLITGGSLCYFPIHLSSPSSHLTTSSKFCDFRFCLVWFLKRRTIKPRFGIFYIKNLKWAPFQLKGFTVFTLNKKTFQYWPNSQATTWLVAFIQKNSS